MTKASSILLSISLIISGFATLILGGYLVFTIVIATNPNYNGVAAYNTLTFTGNVSNGELVNITDAITGSVYRFEFNTTGTNPGTVCLTANCIRVNVSIPYNTSIYGAANLTTAMNANTSFASLLTASNNNENIAVVTYNTIGRTYNGVVTTADTVTNAAWTNSAITGGQDRVMGQAETITYATIVLPLMGLLLMVFGFISLMASLTDFRINAGKGFSVNNKNGNSTNNTNNERSSGFDEGRG